MDDVRDAGDIPALRTFDGFVAGTDCTAWLFTIMRSVIINRFKHDQRRPETSLDAIPDDVEGLSLVDANLLAVVDQVTAPEVERRWRRFPTNFARRSGYPVRPGKAES